MKRSLSPLSPDETKRKADLKKTEKKHQNRDVCDACGGVGQFLCCDACPSAFHFTCVEPPMDSVDVANLKEKWFCNHCEHKQHKKTRAHPRGLFSKLLDDLAQRNPKAFRLPTEITHFYKGVSTDKYGRYVDTTQYKRTKNSQLEQADYHLLKNKQGLILCYYCRKTSLKKQMIACDYCNLYWHLDCLNPPLAASPPLTKKWRCPHHIENFIKPRRQLRNPADVTIITHNATPACTYQNYLDHLLDTDEDIPQTKPDKPSSIPSEDLIVSQEGIAYRLPAKPIQFDLSRYLLHSSCSASIQSDHTSTMTSTDTTTASDEVDTWLYNLACFKAGSTSLTTSNEIAMLIHTICHTDSSDTSLKTKKMDMETYQRYQLIEQLLKEKSEQELHDLLT